MRFRWITMGFIATVWAVLSAAPSFASPIKWTITTTTTSGIASQNASGSFEYNSNNNTYSDVLVGAAPSCCGTEDIEYEGPSELDVGNEELNSYGAIVAYDFTDLSFSAGLSAPHLKYASMSYDWGAGRCIDYCDTEYPAFTEIGGTGYGFVSNAPLPAAFPLPAALPLFATGLGVVGLFGWRRRRKNATY
jgi:hypothetical protein